MTWNSPVALILPPDLIYTEGGLQSYVNLNTTNTKQAFIFQAKNSANVQSLFFRTGGASSVQPISVSLQSVDSTSYPPKPSGTILGATNNGYGTVASPAATTTYEVTLGETVAVTAGTEYAFVVEWTSTAGGFLQIATGVNISMLPLGRASVFNMRQTYASGSWGNPASYGAGGGVPIGIKTDAANWWMPGFVMPGPSNSMNTTYSSSSNPDEFGNKLYLPSGDLTGLWVVSDQDGTGTVVLYDNADNVIVSATIVPNERGTNGYSCCFYQVSPVAITEGWYRVTQKPDTTTTVSRFVCAYTANQENGRAMGANCHLTQRTDNGSWTDTTTSMMMIGVEMEPTFGSSGSVRSVNIRGGADQ